MTFLPNIPQAADDPAVSQGQIQTNFQQLEAVFDVDHVPYTSGIGAGAGYHDRVVFNAIAAAPGLGPRSALHTALSGGFAELFFQNGNNVDRQLTNLSVSTQVYPAGAGLISGTLSWMDVPWGARILWMLSNSFNGNATLLLPAGCGSTITYQITPNTATAGSCGCVVSVAGPPDTLTFGNSINQSLRILIVTSI